MSAGEPEPQLGPRAKIERAKEHLAEFERSVTNFLSASPYNFPTQIDPDGSVHLLVKIMEHPPLRMCAVVGDIVHNAWSALDLLATHLVFMNTGKLEEIHFPIFRRRADFEEKGLKKISNAGAKAKRFIERLQPYEGGRCEPLVLLNRLRTRDTHNLIVPVGAATRHAVFKPKHGGENPLTVETENAPFLEDGQKVFSLAGPGGAHFHDHFDIEFRFEIRLSGVKGLPAESAQKALSCVVTAAERVVAIAENRLF